MSRTDRLRFGIVGCGVVAGYGHGPALERLAEADLVATYDPCPEAARGFASRFGGEAFADEDAFYSQPMDAVIVASPLASHRHHVLRAAARGLHVLCEKPIAETVEAAREMQVAMTRAEKVFAVGLVYRHSIVTRTLLEWVAEGLLGEIRLARFTYLWSLHGRYERGEDGAWRESARWRGRMEEGGPLIDCGVHFLDLARMFLGEIEGIQGFGTWLAGYEAPDHVLATADHVEGRSIIEVGFSYGHTARDPSSLFTYDLVGTGGTARYARDGWVLERRDGVATTRAPGGSEKDFLAMLEEFVGAIRGEEAGILGKAEDALQATRWAIAATNDAIERAENRTRGEENRPRRNFAA